MADQLSLRGGTTTEHATFTGANKEVTVDTTKKTLVVNDGATVGGHPLMRENASNSALALGSAGTPSLKFTGDTNTGIYSPGADQVSIATNGTERLRVDNAGQIEAVSLGTATAPTFSFVGDPNTGIYSPGADQLAVATNGVGRLFVDASGNVGVGTASPGSIFEIKAFNPEVYISNTFGTGQLRIGSFTNGAFIGTYGDNGGTSDLIRFGTASGSEKMRITSAGLVGIGTSTPAARLQVQADSTSTVFTDKNHPGETSGAVFANVSNTVGNFCSITALVNQGSSAQSASFIAKSVATGNTPEIHLTQRTAFNVNTSRLMIDSSGRVGIGTTDPGAYNDAAENLVIAGGANTGVSIVSGSATGASRIYFARGTSAVGSDDRKGQINYLHTDDALQLVTAASERARIDSSGRLLVGTSSAFNSGSTIEAAGSSGGVVTLTNTNTNITGANSVFGQINFYTADISGGNTGIFAKITAESNANFDGSGSRGMDLKFFTGNVAIGANTPTERLRITTEGVLQIADAGNITVGTTTGTKIGTATTQKLGFYNATPVVQPAAVADATDAASVIARLNDLLARLRTLGIIAT